MKSWIFIVLLVMLNHACIRDSRNRDKQGEPLSIVTSYAEGTFTIGVFELNTDSAWRMWVTKSNTTEDYRGTWVREADSFNLYNQDHKQVKARIYIADSAGHVKSIQCDSTMRNLCETNLGRRLTYHDPPTRFNPNIRGYQWWINRTQAVGVKIQFRSLSADRQAPSTRKPPNRKHQAPRKSQKTNYNVQEFRLSNLLLVRMTKSVRWG